MVCQLDISTSSPSKTNTTATTTSTATSTPKQNKNNNQYLLSSLSLTLLTPNHIKTTVNTVNRRTSSTILNKTTNDQDLTLIKNSISLDNLKKHKQHQYEDLEQNQNNFDDINREVSSTSHGNNQPTEYTTTNDSTLVNSLPDLDSLVLNKCYLFNKKDFRSNLSLSNKNDVDDSEDIDNNHDDDDDDDGDVVDNDYFDNDYFDKNFEHKAVYGISSSSESSTSPINDLQPSSINELSQQQQLTQNHLSVSPSISISLSNDTKSVNSCVYKESPSPLSHEHVLVVPLASKVQSRSILPLNPNYLAAEIASLSSLTSNYSQFDFISEPQQQQEQKVEIKKSNTFSAFFNRFTSSKNKSLKTATTTTTTITSVNNDNTSTIGTPSGNRLFGGAFKLFQSASSSNSDNTVPSSVLILENRPR